MGDVVCIVGGVRGATLLPQLFEFEVATCRTCRLGSKKAIPRLTYKNDEALGKAGVLACLFDTP